MKQRRLRNRRRNGAAIAAPRPTRGTLHVGTFVYVICSKEGSMPRGSSIRVSRQERASAYNKAIIAHRSLLSRDPIPRRPGFAASGTGSKSDGSILPGEKRGVRGASALPPLACGEWRRVDEGIASRGAHSLATAHPICHASHQVSKRGCRVGA